MIDDLVQDPVPPQNPQEMKSRIQRLVKFRADQLQQPVHNDLGELIIEGEKDPAVALTRAQDHFVKFVEMDPNSAREVRDYILGTRQELPLGWELERTMPSRQTVMEGAMIREMRKFRQEHPVAAGIYDVAAPFERFAYAGPQLAVDAGAGILNYLGQNVGVLNFLGGNIRSPDLQAMARMGIRGLVGADAPYRTGGYDVVAAEEAALHETASPAAQFAAEAGDIGGMLKGFMTKNVLAQAPVRAAMAPGEIAGKVATALPEKALKMAGMEKTAGLVGTVGRGAGGFATFEMLSELGRNPDLTREQALEAGKHGLIAGAAMGAAAEISRWALRGLLSAPAGQVKLRGEDGRLLESMREWATKNNIVPAPNETVKSFGYRAIDAWVAGGMEGAPAMPVRKMIAWATRAGIESTGLSALSAEFQEKVLQPIFDRDPNSQADWGVAIEEFGKSFLGMAVAHGRLEDIPALQRRMRRTRTEPQEPEKPADEVSPEVRAQMEADLQRRRAEHRAQMEREMREANERGMAQAEAQDLELQQARAEHRARMTQETRAANEQGQTREAADAAELARIRSEHRARMEQEVLEAEARGVADAAELERIRAEHRARMDQEVAEANARAEQERQGLERQREADTAIRAEQEQRAHQQDLESVFWRDIESGDPAAAEFLHDPAIGDILRQGWQVRRQAATPPPVEGGEVKLEQDLPPVEARGKPAVQMELPGTPFTFEAREGVAYPSRELRELLSLPESMPVQDFAAIVNKAGIFAALDATTLLPGTQISVAPPIFAEGGKMRTIAPDGTLLESPLGPNPEWVPVKSVPARGSDPIDPMQQQVVDALVHVLNNRHDLPQDAMTMLGKEIDVLKDVSQRNSQPVAETLAQMPDLIVGIAGAEPARAAELIKLVGEMLTTKAPEVAIEEFVQKQQPQEPQRQQKTDDELVKEMGEATAEVEMLGEASPQDPAAMKRAEARLQEIEDEIARRVPFQSEGAAMRHFGTQVREAMSEFSEGQENAVARKTIAQEVGNYEFDDIGTMRRTLLEEVVPRIRAIDRTVAERLEAIARGMPTYEQFADMQRLAAEIGEEGLAQARRRAMRPDRSGEAGFLDVGAAAEAIDRAVRGLLRFPVPAIGRVLALPFDMPWTRTFSRAPASKMSEIEDPELRERAQGTFNQIEANTREFQAEWEPMAADMPRYRTQEVRQLEERRWQARTDAGNQAGYSLYHILKESVLRDRFGINMEGLPQSLKRIVGIGSKITRAIRTAAADLKMHVQGRYTPEGHLAEIARTTAKDVLTRQPTLELSDAMQAREGKTYEAVVDVLAKENGMTREAVDAIFREEGFTDARGLKRRDPIEHARRFKYFPDHVRLADGEVVRLLETNPLRHAKRMIQGAAQRLGTVKQLGPDDIRPRQGETPEQAAARGASTPYSDFVESFPEKHRELIALGLRASMGMPTSLLPRDVVAREGWHKFGKVVAAINDVRAALGMTLTSPLQTMPEAFATTAAAFGANRVGRAYQHYFEAAREGRLKEAIEERQRAGGFAMHLHEFFAGGEASTFEQVMSVARTLQNGALLFMDAAQTYVVDLAVHKALHDAVAEWRQGTRQEGDVDGLMTVFDMSRAHAEQVVSGKAPPQAYRQLELNGLARLTGRGELPINKSDFARSRSGLARMVKYTGYFQKQINKLRNATVAMREARTPQEQIDASKNLGKLLGFNMASYMAGQSIIAAVRGFDEFLGLWSETLEDLQSPGGAAGLVGTALLGSMLGGAGSFVTGGIRALFSGDTESKAEAFDAATRAIPLFGTLGNAWDFGEAILANATGEPLGGDNPHAGKTPLQQVGYFTGTQVPLFRWAMNGPFGLGVTYLGTDPELEGAIRASYRIDEKLGVGTSFFGGKRREEDANEDQINDRDLFVDTMRAAVNKLRAREGEVDESAVADAIREAMPDQNDRSIAESLLRRRVLSGKNWTDLTEEQQQSKLRQLGEARVELLRGYDAVLERTARHFRPLRGR